MVRTTAVYVVVSSCNIFTWEMSVRFLAARPVTDCGLFHRDTDLRFGVGLISTTDVIDCILRLVRPSAPLLWCRVLIEQEEWRF
jgi:hypothetical protein